MKKMTKVFTILMCAVLAFSFWSCENPATSNTKNNGNQNSDAGKGTTATGTQGTATTTVDPLTIPLTIEVISAEHIYVVNPWSTLKYKKNGGEAVRIIATEPDVNNHGMQAVLDVAAGDKLEFFADGSENKTMEYPLTIWCRNGTQCYAYGNVMSLLDSVNYATLKEIRDEKAFNDLFNSSKILTHPDKDILLPATTLKKSCYSGMFYGASISKAPLLPATTLAENCYNNMFSVCLNLTQAPELPAQVLVKKCYEYMFYYCHSLNYVKCLATDISSEDCTSNWLGYVSDTGTFVKAEGANWSSGTNGIPAGWTTE